MAKKAASTAPVNQPQFAQPAASPDPTKFTVAHGNDNALYKKVQNSLLQAIPSPRPGASLTVNLADALDRAETAAQRAIDDWQAGRSEPARRPAATAAACAAVVISVRVIILEDILRTVCISYRLYYQLEQRYRT